MSLRELCDAAEVTWGALADRQDQLRLLALIARAQPGVKGLRNYTPGSEALAGWLGELDQAADPAERRSEVMRFVAATGGESG